MKTKSNHISTNSPKKAYQTPRVKSLGNVKKLTLKTGSNTDTFGVLSCNFCEENLLPSLVCLQTGTPSFFFQMGCHYLLGCFLKRITGD
ncbi:hypothetical protein HMF3257_27705 [Spirosoma telluris]|uniref:Uncharacterized protein n=1 Tax=Spirosoma telluris TaxID=2183553 RepID=A0A327NT92_9BACT|nr:hypothetical protein HMF3257_27705 [Spirosoma telluris]